MRSGDCFFYTHAENPREDAARGALFSDCMTHTVLSKEWEQARGREGVAHETTILQHATIILVHDGFHKNCPCKLLEHEGK